VVKNVVFPSDRHRVSDGVWAECVEEIAMRTETTDVALQAAYKRLAKRSEEVWHTLNNEKGMKRVDHNLVTVKLPIEAEALSALALVGDALGAFLSGHQVDMLKRQDGRLWAPLARGLHKPSVEKGGVAVGLLAALLGSSEEACLKGAVSEVDATHFSDGTWACDVEAWWFLKGLAFLAHWKQESWCICPGTTSGKGTMHLVLASTHRKALINTDQCVNALSVRWDEAGWTTALGSQRGDAGRLFFCLQKAGIKKAEFVGNAGKVTWKLEVPVKIVAES
jgi:hypothetical protein